MHRVAPTAPSPADRRFSGWRILILATIAMGMTGPGQTIGVSVFIDHFADDLDLSKNAVAAGYAVGTLTGSLMLPSVGRWIDRFGVRRAMTTIAIGFVIALTAMAGVQGLVSLTIGFVFIRMLGQGSLSLVSMVSVSLWFDRRRGLALGVAMTISSAMMALFPVALSYVIGEAGWRSAWLIAAGVVGVVVVPIAWFGMIDSPAAVDQFVDGIGPDGRSEVAASSTTQSLDRAGALRTRSFWMLASAVVMSSMLGTGLIFHQIALLGESGFTETEAAIMFLPQVIGTFVGSPAMGMGIDRIGSRLAPAVALLGLATTLVLAGTVSSTTTVIVYAMVFGLTAGATRTLGAALIPKWFGVAHIGSIQGALTFIGVLGSAAGPIALSVTEGFTGSFRDAAIVWAVVPLAAAFLVALPHRLERS